MKKKEHTNIRFTNFLNFPPIMLGAEKRFANLEAQKFLIYQFSVASYACFHLRMLLCKKTEKNRKEHFFFFFFKTGEGLCASAHSRL